MFVSNRIVYLELHKTGTTHIRRLLADVVGGRKVGKHNPITPDLLDGARMIVGSIRDPWEWYVSVWAYGCDHRGDLYDHAAGPRRLRGHGWRRDPIRAVGRLGLELRRQPGAWRRCYTHSDDAPAFRDWLRLVLDGALPYQVYEYGAPSIGRLVGLMSYRYLHVYCGPADKVDAMSRLESREAVAAFEREHNVVDYFIRNEALEATFAEALRRSGVELSEADADRVANRPHLNASSRRRETGYFYDSATAAMVAERDSVIVDRFGYTSPLIAAPAVEPAWTAAAGGADLGAENAEAPAGATPG